MSPLCFLTVEATRHVISHSCPHTLHSVMDCLPPALFLISYFLPQKWEKEEVCAFLHTALPEVFHSPDTQITSSSLLEGEQQSRNSLFCFANGTHKGESILTETQLVLAEKHISFTTSWLHKYNCYHSILYIINWITGWFHMSRLACCRIFRSGKAAFWPW